MAGRLRMLLESLAIVYGLYAGALFVFQQQMIYPTHLINAPEQGMLPDELSERWELRAGDARVEAWLLRPFDAQAPYPVILFTHGNGDVIDVLPPYFAWPRARGIGVLLLEYPGYGRSTGSPGQRSIHEALLAAHDRLSARPDVRADRIIGYGQSLGGGAITTLVGERPLAGLVLRSTFTRMADFAHRYALPAFLLRDRYDNLAAVAEFDGPVVVMHGTEDRTIPFSMGQRLADAAGVPLVSFPCGHNGCPPDEQVFWEALAPLFTALEISTEVR